jgi:gluconokinase
MPAAAGTATRVVVVMGVSGAGKSTVARRLADVLGWDFAEGDELHPAANVAKMAAGQPLNDADRHPWLLRVAAWIDAEISANRSGVIACSALTHAYRDLLRRPEVVFVYLEVSRAELARRVRARAGHFMPASLLDSQLEALEPPGPDERALRIDADGSPGRTVELIRRRLTEARPAREPCS